MYRSQNIEQCSQGSNQEYNLRGGGGAIVKCQIFVIYNYFIRKLWTFYFTEGFRDQFDLQNIPKNWSIYFFRLLENDSQGFPFMY